MIEFKCALCSAEMEAPQSQAGEVETCPRCGVRNRVPLLPPQAPPPPFFPTFQPPVVAPNQVRPPWPTGEGRTKPYVWKGQTYLTPEDVASAMRGAWEPAAKAEEIARLRQTLPGKLKSQKAKDGFVYLLTTAAMPEHVKVGKTQLDPEYRAKELSDSTSVPIPFQVAYAERFRDCSAAEKFVHAQLNEYRTNRNREFFQISVKIAIQAIKNAKEREDQVGG